jgi:hypothetical protein
MVRHFVPAARGSLKYMLSRSWSEGISKAQVSKVVGHKRALGPERRYVRRVLPRAVFIGVKDWLMGKDKDGLRRAATVVAVLAVTTFGYVQGRRFPGGALGTEPGQDVAAGSWREVS